MILKSACKCCTLVNGVAKKRFFYFKTSDLLICASVGRARTDVLLGCPVIFPLPATNYPFW